MTALRTLILFDVDGTLIDSQVHILKAMEFAFLAQNLPLPSRKKILSIVRLSLFEAFGQLCPDADEAQRADLVMSYKDGFSTLRQTTIRPSRTLPWSCRLWQKQGPRAAS